MADPVTDTHSSAASVMMSEWLVRAQCDALRRRVHHTLLNQWLPKTRWAATTPYLLVDKTSSSCGNCIIKDQ
jgi:hypothetical protein